MGERLDVSAQLAADKFMAMPEMPTIQRDATGREISGFATTDAAAAEIIEALDLPYKLELWEELLAEGNKYDFDWDAMFSGEPKSIAEIFDTLLSEVITNTIDRMPEVMERQASNMRLHDSYLGYDDEDDPDGR